MLFDDIKKTLEDLQHVVETVEAVADTVQDALELIAKIPTGTENQEQEDNAQ
jgi:hypothetical protein